MDKKKRCKSNVDCAKGRELGCHNFCCRMLIKLDPEEMTPTSNGAPAKGYVDKDKDGYCIHFDKDSGRCKIWQTRPRVCREYSCNSDFLLQVVLRNGFENIANTAKQAATAYIPLEKFRYIPLIDDDDKTE